MPGRAEDRVEILQRGAGLDHGERDDMIVGFAQIDRLVGNAAERHRPVRSPAALADRRKFGRRGEGARVGGGIDHRRDDAFGAEIERAADRGEIAERHAHDRRGAALADRGDGGENAAEVPQPVLAVERHRGKAIARQRLGDERIGQAAPAGKDGFSGAQPAGESEGGNGHECRLSA